MRRRLVGRAYIGTRYPVKTTVRVLDGAELFLVKLDPQIATFGPTEDALEEYGTPLDWGNDSDGAARLSYALIYDAVDLDHACRFYCRFLELVVSRLPRESFIMLADDVRGIVSALAMQGPTPTVPEHVFQRPRLAGGS